MVGYNQFGVLWQMLRKFLTSQTYVVIYHAPKFTKLNKLDMLLVNLYIINYKSLTWFKAILGGIPLLTLLNYHLGWPTVINCPDMLLVNPLSLLCDAISCSFLFVPSMHEHVVFQKTYHLFSNNSIKKKHLVQVRIHVVGGWHKWNGET